MVIVRCRGELILPSLGEVGADSHGQARRVLVVRLQHHQEPLSILDFDVTRCQCSKGDPTTRYPPFPLVMIVSRGIGEEEERERVGGGIERIKKEERSEVFGEFSGLVR